MKTGNLPTAQYPQEILRSEDVLGILALFAGQRIIQWQPLKTAFKVIGFRKHTDILVFGALVRSIWLPPGGEAVERSETDEERRNRPILYTVRKKGTI